MRFLGKKVLKKLKRVAHAEYRGVPRCARGLGTLLFAYTNDNSSKTGCATCATGFFLSLKKKFALEFHYTLAQLPLHVLDKIKA